VDAVGVASVRAWNPNVAMCDRIRQAVADFRVWRPDGSSQPTPFLYIYQGISPYFCEVAYPQQSYAGLIEPVGNHDTTLRDVCMRPAISGIFDCTTLPWDAVSKIGVQNTAALPTVSRRILSQEPTLKLHLSAHDTATLAQGRASVAKIARDLRLASA
jgi:hypothetical protein